MRGWALPAGASMSCFGLPGTTLPSWCCCCHCVPPLHTALTLAFLPHSTLTYPPMQAGRSPPLPPRTHTTPLCSPPSRWNHAVPARQAVERGEGEGAILQFRPGASHPLSAVLKERSRALALAAPATFFPKLVA